jgi:hypothetical protein
MPSDGKSSHGLWPGDLERIFFKPKSQLDSTTSKNNAEFNDVIQYNDLSALITASFSYFVFCQVFIFSF